MLTGPNENDRAWDEFVEAHPFGTPFHLTAWRNSLVENFRYQPHYMVYAQDGVVEGVLPLFLVKGLFLGKALISTPFAVYGGVLATSERAKADLLGRAVDLAKRLNVEHLDLRNTDSSQCGGFHPIDRYVDYTQPVQASTSDELLEALPRKIRNKIRKSLKTPFTSQPTSDLGGFISIIAETYRRLGTPAFPDKWFRSLVRNFGPRVDVREIRLGEDLVCASMNFKFRGAMHTYYSGSRSQFLALAPNNFMFFDHLLWAGNNGFDTFDFGRSKIESGHADFKKQWLTTERALPYEIFLVNGKAAPNLSPTNSKFRLGIQLWQKMPLPLTRIIGPLLIDQFP